MNENKKLVMYILILIGILLVASIVYNLYSKNSKGNVDNKLQEIAKTIKDNTITNNNVNSDEKSKSLDFIMYDENNKKVNLADFKGKPIVINFWTSWCYYCKQEMPDFQEIYNEEKDNINFIMLNVPDGYQETVEKALKFKTDQNYDFPVYFDINYEGSTLFQVSGYPTTVFIDKEFNITSIYPSMLTRDMLIEKINEIKN